MIATKDTPIGFELPEVKREMVQQIAGSRLWGRANPFHWDPQFAEEMGLPGPAITGTIMDGYIKGMMVNFFGHAFFSNSTIQCKYISPIFTGDILTVKGIVEEKSPEDSGVRLKVKVWVEKEGMTERPVLVGNASAVVK